MNEDEAFQLAPGPQWFYVREQGKAWGIAVEAKTGFEAREEAMRQFATQGRIVSPSVLEVTWLHPNAITQIVATRPSPIPVPRAKVRARPKGKRRSA